MSSDVEKNVAVVVGVRKELMSSDVSFPFIERKTYAGLIYLGNPT